MAVCTQDHTLLTNLFVCRSVSTVLNQIIYVLLFRVFFLNVMKINHRWVGHTTYRTGKRGFVVRPLLLVLILKNFVSLYASRFVLLVVLLSVVLVMSGHVRIV